MYYIVSEYRRLSHELHLCNKLLKDIDREIKQVYIKPGSHGILLKSRREALGIKADIINDIDRIADQLELKTVLDHFKTN